MNRNRPQHSVGSRRRQGRRIWRTWAGIAKVVWTEIRARPNRARLYETHDQVAQFGRPDRQDPRNPSLIAYGLHDDRPVRIVRDAGMVFTEVWDPDNGWWVPSTRTSWRVALEEAAYIAPELLIERGVEPFGPTMSRFNRGEDVPGSAALRDAVRGPESVFYRFYAARGAQDGTIRVAASVARRERIALGIRDGTVPVPGGDDQTDDLGWSPPLKLLLPPLGGVPVEPAAGYPQRGCSRWAGGLERAFIAVVATGPCSWIFPARSPSTIEATSSLHGSGKIRYFRSPRAAPYASS